MKKLLSLILSLIRGRVHTTPHVAESTPYQDLAEPLNWSRGGFCGKVAHLATDCIIRDLKVTTKGLNYSWQSGDCSILGATSHTDHTHTLACLFVKLNGTWHGGKFDWISTSRTTRDFKNIYENYHGWSARDITQAEAYAFAIYSADGKLRSNIITTED